MARLLIVADTFAPAHGGSERVLYSFARAASELGHEVRVFTTKRDRAREKPFDAGQPFSILRSLPYGILLRLGGNRAGIVSRLARAALTLYLFLRLWVMRSVDATIVGHIIPGGNAAVAIKR